MNHFIKTRTHYKIVGIKKERQQVFYLLSALETVPEIAVRSAILFSGGISPSPSFYDRMGLIFYSVQREFLTLCRRTLA